VKLCDTTGNAVRGGPSLVTEEQNIARIKQNCGRELKISPEIKKLAPPVVGELRLLRLLDAERIFLRKAERGVICGEEGASR